MANPSEVSGWGIPHSTMKLSTPEFPGRQFPPIKQIYYPLMTGILYLQVTDTVTNFLVACQRTGMSLLTVSKGQRVSA